MTLTILLPIPPSINRMYRVSGGRLHKSDRYKTWAAAALGEYRAQNGHLLPKIGGHFTAHVTLNDARRGTSDLDNRVKVLFDFLQAEGVRVISNDRYCDSLTVHWGKAPAGCIVVLSAVEGRAA